MVLGKQGITVMRSELSRLQEIRTARSTGQLRYAKTVVAVTWTYQATDLLAQAVATAQRHSTDTATVTANTHGLVTSLTSPCIRERQVSC